MSLFKKFAASQVTGSDTLKASLSRQLKQELATEFPAFAENLEELFPKKANVVVYRTKEKMNFLCHDGVCIFFKDRNGTWCPTLRLVQQYPAILPKLQVDRPAIPFVLKGAPIMVAGFTAAGGDIPDDIAAEKYVAIYAEGKENPIAIGMTTISTDEMKSGTRGTGVNNLTFMGDGLWTAGPFKA